MEPGTEDIRFADKLQHAVASFLFKLPHSVQVKLSGKPPIVRAGLTLHPELQLLLSIRERKKTPGFSALPHAKTRVLSRREAIVHAGTRIEVKSVRDLEVDGGGGPVMARHYAPENVGNDPAPLLVFFHGGGFVIGDLDTYDPLCRLLCRHAGVHVLSVDYRLAPEHPFPAAVEDVRASYLWATQHAAELGAHPSRIAVGGDSAGGNLSAVLAQLMKAEGGPTPAAQLLMYPAIDRTKRRPSMEHFADGFFLTQADIEWFQNHYVGATNVHADPRIAPLRFKDLKGLPPAIVVTAGFDPLRDEGEEYADVLKAAGVPVVQRRFENLIHGFANMTGLSPACREATIEVAGALRALLSTAAH
ncbi:MAG: alpha/beta hydrolase [Myxococcaceae bacterium]